jgi:hypothetical protein
VASDRAGRSTDLARPRQPGLGAPGGGIDSTVDGNPTSASAIANAKKMLPPYVDRYGLIFVRALGVDDFADPPPPDPCVTMPQEVADRIAREEAAPGGR